MRGYLAKCRLNILKQEKQEKIELLQHSAATAIVSNESSCCFILFYFMSPTISQHSFTLVSNQASVDIEILFDL